MTSAQRTCWAALLFAMVLSLSTATFVVAQRKPKEVHPFADLHERLAAISGAEAPFHDLRGAIIAAHAEFNTNPITLEKAEHLRQSLDSYGSVLLANCHSVINEETELNGVLSAVQQEFHSAGAEGRSTQALYKRHDIAKSRLELIEHVAPKCRDFFLPELRDLSDRLAGLEARLGKTSAGEDDEL